MAPAILGTETGQIGAKPIQQNDVEASPRQPPRQYLDTSAHFPHTAPHLAGVPEEYGRCADLAEVVARWASLPDDLRADLLAKVREAAR